MNKALVIAISVFTTTQLASANAQDLPRCSSPIGTVSVINGDTYRGWRAYDLGEPEQLLKVLVQRSGCFKLVNRGAGLAATRLEQDLGSNRDLQRGSNVGGGQIKTADFALIADVVGTDRNSGGGGVAAGLLGRKIGGKLGGVVGGLKTKKLEAQVVLEVMNVRTTEGVAFAEGNASKTDLSFGGGGYAGFGGIVGGGYEDTEIGKVVTQAFIDAYGQIVDQLGGVSSSAADAPREIFQVREATVLRRSPSKSSSVVRSLDARMYLYPLGGKEGTWWEVEDENGNVGWVENFDIEPAHRTN